jgi:hypothetical protein
MNNNFNKHIIITTDSCIHIQESDLGLDTYIDSIKEQFTSVLNNCGIDESYAHVFDGKGFPVHKSKIDKDSCDLYVDRICASISAGFMTNNYDLIDNDTLIII